MKVSPADLQRVAFETRFYPGKTVCKKKKKKN